MTPRASAVWTALAIAFGLAACGAQAPGPAPASDPVPTSDPAPAYDPAPQKEKKLPKRIPTVSMPREAVEADGTASIPTELADEWTLVAIDGAPAPVAGKTPTLEILADGSAAGTSGVNRYRTSFEIGDGSLSFGPAMGTKMAGPPDAMELERVFLERLGAVSTYRLDGDTLELRAGDIPALTFRRSGN